MTISGNMVKLLHIRLAWGTTDASSQLMVASALTGHGDPLPRRAPIAVLFQWGRAANYSRKVFAIATLERWSY